MDQVVPRDVDPDANHRASVHRAFSQLTRWPVRVCVGCANFAITTGNEELDFYGWRACARCRAAFCSACAQGVARGARVFCDASCEAGHRK